MSATHEGAYMRGYEDRAHGHHLNPYPFDTQPEEFRSWIAGYNAARDFEEMFTESTK